MLAAAEVVSGAPEPAATSGRDDEVEQCPAPASSSDKPLAPRPKAKPRPDVSAQRAAQIERCAPPAWCTPWELPPALRKKLRDCFRDFAWEFT